MDPLETDALTKRFKSVTAVDRLSLRVGEGEVFGLLGPNGAGKTTTIKMLTTLMKPSDGRARICGYDVVRESHSVRRLIGYVPQLISADGTLSGFENLLIFARLYEIPRRERKRKIGDALEFMGLTEAAGRLVREYSGGMIRRLEIAQSLLHSPRLLFLDEPTIGLDPVARRAVLNRVDELRRTFGMTVVLTTHFMEEADAVCSRIAVMHLGKIAALGAPAALKASLGLPNATLDDVFIHYTGTTLDSGGTYHEARRTRRAVRRLG